MALAHGVVLIAVLIIHSHTESLGHQRIIQGQNDSLVSISPTAPPEHSYTKAFDHDGSFKQPDTSPNSVSVASMPKRDWADWLVLFSNIGLAAVGCGGIMIAIRTLCQVRKQTESIQRQADYLLQSERAWMIPDDDALKHFRIVFRNRGKSPARVVYWDGLLASYRLTDVLSNEVLIDTGRYTVGGDENSELVHAVMVAPGGELDLGSIDWRAIFGEHEADIIRGNKHLHVWTCVKYRSSVGLEKYESRVCYRVLPSGFRLGGPEGANNYT